MNLRDITGGRAAQARLNAQKGFTLVEMAIVLVIIGLIVGGILKGQEIVNNGRVKTQVAQIDAIKAAVETFKDKYGYYPGDDATVDSQLGVSTTFNGNGDGVVSSTAGSPDADDAVEAASKEPNAVWFELQQANLISGVRSSDPTAVTNAQTYNYDAKIAGGFLAYADFSIAAGGATVANKMVRISGVVNSTTPTPVMREQDASQIDLKYDDGRPSTGQIIASSYSSSACCSGTACKSAATTLYGLAAGVSASGSYCALLWQTQ